MASYKNILKEQILSEKLDVSKLEFGKNYFTRRWRQDNETFRELLIREIDTHKRTASRLLKDLGLKKKDLFDEPIYIPTKFNIFGCPLSTDLDIAVLVEDQNIISKYIDDIIEVDFSEIEKGIASLGYSSSRAFDITLVFVDDRGNICETSKGSTPDTHNMIFNTHMYHRQQDACFIDHPVHVHMIDKLRATSKYIADYLEYFIGKEEYVIERMARRASYATYWGRVEYPASVIHKIIYPDNISYSHLSRLKALTMKFIQLFLLNRGECCYTKKELSIKAGELFPELEDAEEIAYSLLTRQIHAKALVLYGIMIENYKNIVEKVRDEYDWISLDADLGINLPEIIPELLAEFIKSPDTPTERFKILFRENYDIDNINQSFIHPTFGIEYLPYDIADRTLLCDQRSPEWLDAMKFYLCGKSGGVVDKEGDPIVTRYNLIRGCLMELVMAYAVDYTGIPSLEKTHKCNIGLIVEEKDIKLSPGVAPDLLLLDEDSITVVEMKCFMGIPGEETSDFRRACKLANAQLHSAEKIIGVDCQKLFVIMFIYKNEHNEWQFDVKGAMIS